jgi:hypothetical protein
MVKQNKNGVEKQNEKKKRNEIQNNIVFSKKDYNRFEISFPYNQDILQICKETAGRKFDLDTKSWSFPIQQYKSLIQKLKTKKDFSIEKDLSEKEINNIQVVIIDQDNFFIYVQFPHNDVLKRIVYNL